jgi:hypothetical protein
MFNGRMNKQSLMVLLVVAGVLGAASVLRAQDAPESVYPTELPPPPPDDRNQPGGVGAEFKVNYLTDYIFRGTKPFLDPDDDETSLALQVDGKISLDLGKLPHPFVGLFVNVGENDPISSFQEVRPTVGFDWPIKPLVISAGHTNYIYPNREDLDTSEVFVQIELDDSELWDSGVFLGSKLRLRPYAFGAYDYDLYEGVYLQAGLRPSFEVENTGLSFTFDAHATYVIDHDYFTLNGTQTENGFQHWQVGLTGRYDLNQLLNIPQRFGEWSVLGYLNYTGAIDNELKGEDLMWGGAGLRLAF